MPKNPDLVDYRDVAELTGHNVEHLRVIQSRGQMPKPAIKDYPIWDRAAILEWIRTDPRATPTRKRRRKDEK